MSDTTADEIQAIIRDRLGDRLERYAVRMDDCILSEASVSAVIRFTWRNPDRERERSVFKVLKPYVPACFAEDMRVLQELGEYLTSKERGYGFAVREVNEMITEVRLLLEHELDFAREQATLAEAARTYRSTIGIRVPRVIPELCSGEITAMSEESGVKVTDAVPHSPIRRARIAEQLIEALIAVPLFSGKDPSVFHADPHAGNLLYDEANRELVILDWALAERLSLSSRRHLMLLAIMMALRNREGVRAAICGLRREERGGRKQSSSGDRSLGRPLLRPSAGGRLAGSPGRHEADGRNGAAWRTFRPGAVSVPEEPVYPGRRSTGRRRLRRPDRPGHDAPLPDAVGRQLRPFLQPARHERFTLCRVERPPLSGAVPQTEPGMGSYRFRPCFSWLDTQSEEEIAAPSEISPASATPATISASRLTLPLPEH